MRGSEKLLLASVMASLHGFILPVNNADVCHEENKSRKNGRQRQGGESYSKYLKYRQIEKRKSK